LSHTTTTNHLLSVIAITNTLVSVSNASFIPEQERRRKLVRQATHGMMEIQVSQAHLYIKDVSDLETSTLTTLISVQHILFFLRHFSHLHALLVPPRLLISKELAIFTVFNVINIKKFLPKCPY
jgi:hypothetical protein